MQHDDSQRFPKDSPLSVIDSSGRQISLLNDGAAAAAAAAAAGAATGPPTRPPLYSPQSMEYESTASREPPPYGYNASPAASYSPSSSSSSSMEDSSNRDGPGGDQPSWNSTQAAASAVAAVPAAQKSTNGRRKYHCTEPGCNKSFTTSGHLARHNRIHTGEKNFPCLFPGCQSRFSRQDNMMQHYRTHMSPKSRRSQRSKAAAVAAAEEARPRPRLHAHHRIRSDPFGVEPPLTIDQHLSNYHQSLLSPSARTERFSPTRYTQDRPRTPSTPTSSTANTTATTTTTTTTTAPENAHAPDTHTTQDNTSTTPDKHDEPSAIFYQHRPLTLHSTPAGQGPPFPFTLLHPPLKHDSDDKPAARDKDDASDGGLLQLAHVVSTFG